MIDAFSPGHITCFFQPVSSFNPLSTGSVGAGLRINMGSTVTVRPARGEPITEIDGKITEGRIVRNVVRAMDPDCEYDITVKNDLPVGQGFGMSAANAVAASLCMCRITGKDISEGYRVAHKVELLEGGGRGDVSGIMSQSRQPIRIVAGLPPFGRVEDSSIPLDNLTLFTVGPPIETKSILSNRAKMAKIRETGAAAFKDYLDNVSLNSLFRISNRFSKESNLCTPEMDDAIAALKDVGHMAAMCMLGASIFTTASEETVKEVIGDVWTASCRTTAEEARVTRIK